MWVPAGAVIAARIVRIRHYYGSASALALDVKLETVDVAGVPVRLTAIGSRLPVSIGRKIAIGCNVGCTLDCRVTLCRKPKRLSPRIRSYKTTVRTAF